LLSPPTKKRNDTFHAYLREYEESFVLLFTIFEHFLQRLDFGDIHKVLHIQRMMLDALHQVRSSVTRRDSVRGTARETYSITLAEKVELCIAHDLIRGITVRRQLLTQVERVRADHIPPYLRRSSQSC
jgi:hypothetical protein